MQVNYKASEKLTLNYSNFIGLINIDSTDALRIFHNLYAIYEATHKLSFIFGFDIGTQKEVDAKAKVWYTPVIISKIHLSEKSKLAVGLSFIVIKNKQLFPLRLLMATKQLGPQSITIIKFHLKFYGVQS